MAEELPAAPDKALVGRLVEAALEEDAARRDVTTLALIPPDQGGQGTIVAKEEGVIAGLPVAAAVFRALAPAVTFVAEVSDGARVSRGEVVARLEGPLRPILAGERVALNFLQRLSGVATATARLVDAVGGLATRILDTRKTTPGLRVLERYAVRVGGGHSHRFHLADGILIKDNHLAAARSRGLSMAEVIARARLDAPPTLRVEVEVTSVEEALEALAGGAEVIMLDNMDVGEMRRVVEEARGRALIEASGGITLENVRAVAETGVDFISVGAITHSTAALDMSLELSQEG
jgi:nicotinate-nucleotide pyrophosphorylase (carboxylating)